MVSQRPLWCRYVRLELLQGAAALYAGDRAAAKRWLLLAQEKWEQLQVSDQDLASLLALGFTPQEVRPPAPAKRTVSPRNVTHY